jgi:hypothetical protein
MSAPKIDGYPDFARLADQEVARQLKLVWDQLQALARGEQELEAKVPDTSSLSKATTTLTQLQQAANRRISGLTAADIAAVATGRLTAANLQLALSQLQSPPGAWLSRSSDFSHNSSGNWLLFTADTANEDNNSICDTVNSRLVCKTAGLYRVWLTSSWETNATGARFSLVTRNGIVGVGTSACQANQQAITDAGAATVYGNSQELRLAVDDYLVLNLKQTSGGTLLATSVLTKFGMRWLSP